MLNPVLNSAVVVLWFLTFMTDVGVTPFAIGTTIYWVINTLFMIPTIPRGKLPQLDDIYVRAFLSNLFCLKKQQLLDSETDIIPAIATEAKNILFSVDTLWDYDIVIRAAIDRDQSNPRMVEYLSKDPLEKSEMKTILPHSSSATHDTPVHEEDKMIITKHMQRINTIPLTINPSYYLVPAYNLDACIQTFLYFPLSFWSKAVLTMTDMTVYFPVPRGIQFFFESNIINIRPVPDSSDLQLDIQTLVLIDKLRLERGYNDEQKEDKMLSEKFAKIKVLDEQIKAVEGLPVEEQTNLKQLHKEFDTLHQELTLHFSNEEISKTLVDSQSTKAGQPTSSRRGKKQQTPQELVLVSRVVTTYTYNNVVGPKFDFKTQEQFPIADMLKQQQPNVAPKFIEQQLDAILYPSESKTPRFLSQKAKPLLTLQVAPKDSSTFAHLSGNIHPRMLHGMIPTMLGYGSPHNSQFDALYPTHVALSLYSAIHNDNLACNGMKYSLFEDCLTTDSTTAGDTENTDQDQSIKQMFPYRAILKTNATCSSPATIKAYLDETSTRCDTYIEHYGYQYAQLDKKRQEAKKANLSADKTELLLAKEAIEEISTESFPQFTQRRDILITVVDGDGEIVWADGVILSHPKLL